MMHLFDSASNLQQGRGRIRFASWFVVG